MWKLPIPALRPGEKMYEELYHDKENMTKSSHSMIFKLKPIRDCDALNSEIASLLRVIRWDSAEFERVRAWIEEHIMIDGSKTPSRDKRW
ncbi:MAG: polysaccharide biosynthesis protein [Saccharofermentanales bacterium]